MTSAQVPKPRVLVVDDDKAVRESLRRSLEFNGYEVALATDGVACGQHQDGDVVLRRTQRAGGLDPVQPGHHHVHDHHVGIGRPDPGQRLGPVGGQGHLVAVELQRTPQRLAHRLVVVDDQHARLHSRPCRRHGGHAARHP